MSPMSRPTFAGSMSTAPTILKPGRDATCFTIAAPIGPSPKCITLMLGMTRGLYSRATSRDHRSSIDTHACRMHAATAIRARRRQERTPAASDAFDQVRTSSIPIRRSSAIVGRVEVLRVARSVADDTVGVHARELLERTHLVELSPSIGTRAAHIDPVAV